MEKTTKDELKEFRQKLNRPPRAEEIRKGPGGPYIPISFLQSKLDFLFGCDWSWTVESETLVANEILVRGTLTLLHPVTGREIRRAGIGARPIRLRKAPQGQPPTMPTQIERKIMNACEADYPNAAAMAFSSACKTLGTFFGRDVGRNPDQVEDYTELEAQKLNKEQQRLMAFIEKAATPAELFELENGPIPFSKQAQAAYNLKHDKLMTGLDADQIAQEQQQQLALQ